MKLKDLKAILDGLTPKQLNQDLLYKSDEYSISGVVAKVETAAEALYYTGEEDPSPLYTKAQLKEKGYDSEEISEFDIEIPKGALYLKLDSSIS